MKTERNQTQVSVTLLDAELTTATMSNYTPNMSTNIPYQSLLEKLITNASTQPDHVLFITVATFKVVLKSLQAQTPLLVNWIFMTNFPICCLL